MTRAALLDPERTALVVVDLQERFAPAISGWDEIVGRATILARTAALLGLRVVVTEQYPKGLGHTVEPLASALEGTPVLEKSAFPATGAEGFDLAGRDQVLLCGVETHICIQQTALALSRDGIETQVVVDATGTRDPADKEIGLERMRIAGIVPTTTEAAGFELLGSADNPAFGEFQAMIK